MFIILINLLTLFLIGMMFYITSRAYNRRPNPAATPLDIFRDLVDDGSFTNANRVTRLPVWGEMGSFKPYYDPIYDLNYAVI